MNIFKDQLGRRLELSKKPTRIISVVPSITELLYDLGLEENIVGITSYCVHPYHFLSTKKSIGGTKKVNLTRVKELAPDIIICNKEENTPAMVDALSEIAPVYVSDVNTIADSLELILQLGTLLSCRTESRNLISKINFKLEDFKCYMKDMPTRKVAYFIWATPWMVAANNTFINEILTLNKFENIYQNLERYPTIPLEKIRFDGDPRIVLLPSEPFKFTDDHAFEIASYANRSMTVFADGQYFSWYGSRLLKAFDYFKQLQEKIDSSF
ncbi:MAG: ABC transporter substrate-binding protein [Flavobacteriaceae bacterium]|nr:ABC transporter substrate-binding protein [Flavobacteriaceae bacterium]